MSKGVFVQLRHYHTETLIPIFSTSWSLYVLDTCAQFAMGIMVTALPLYLITTLGMSSQAAGLLVGLSRLGPPIAAFPAGYLISKIGYLRSVHLAIYALLLCWALLTIGTFLMSPCTVVGVEEIASSATLTALGSDGTASHSAAPNITSDLSPAETNVTQPGCHAIVPLPPTVVGALVTFVCSSMTGIHLGVFSTARHALFALVLPQRLLGSGYAVIGGISRVGLMIGPMVTGFLFELRSWLAFVAGLAVLAVAVAVMLSVISGDDFDEKTAAVAEIAQRAALKRALDAAGDEAPNSAGGGDCERGDGDGDGGGGGGGADGAATAAAGAAAGAARADARYRAGDGCGGADGDDADDTCRFIPPPAVGQGLERTAGRGAARAGDDFDDRYQDHASGPGPALAQAPPSAPDASSAAPASASAKAPSDAPPASRPPSAPSAPPGDHHDDDDDPTPADAPPVAEAKDARDGDVVGLRATIAVYGRVVAVVATYSFFLQFVRQARAFLLPVMGLLLGLDPGRVGTILAVSSFIDFIVFPFGGALIDRSRSAAAIVLGVGLAVAFAAVPFAQTFGHLMGVGVLFGVANGIGAGIIMTTQADSAPLNRGARPHFLALFNIATLAELVSPVLCGALLDSPLGATGAAVVGVFASLASAAWGGLVLRSPENLRSYARNPPASYLEPRK